MPKTKTLAIAPEVMDVLKRSSIHGNVLTLPEQLDRKLYEKANKVIMLADGKWDRRAQGHVFPSDPRGILGIALEAGEIVDKKKTFQAFYTPEVLADEIAQAANLGPDMHVLEPSVGAGALVYAARRRGVLHIDCMELDETRARATENSLGRKVVVGNFLMAKPNPIYDAVIMNPPFTGGQDIEHVLHAYDFLKPGGVLVAIMSTSWQHSALIRAASFRYFLTVRASGYHLYPLPAGTFSESGTQVATLMVTIHKPSA